MLRRTVICALSLLVCLSCSKLKKDAGGDGGEATGSGGGGGLFGLGGAKEFEGQIVYQFVDKKSAKPPVSFTYEAKQPRMRVDLPASAMGPGDNPMFGKSVWALLDIPAKKAYGVLDDPKKAIVFDFDKMGDDIKKAKSGGPHMPHTAEAPSSDPPPKFEKTGKVDKVAGYDCEIWKITEERTREGKKKNEEVELCMAKDLSWFDFKLLGLGTVDPKIAILMATTDLNHMPLRVITREEGVEESRVEATKIDAKKMPDDRFAVPAGYQVITLDQMFQGLMGGMPGGAPGGMPPHRPGMPPGMPSGMPGAPHHH